MNNHDYSFYIVNLYTVSICDSMIMSIFLFILRLYADERFQQQCNHEICTTTLFFITQFGGTKDAVPPCPKKLGPYHSKVLELLYLMQCRIKAVRGL